MDQTTGPKREARRKKSPKSTKRKRDGETLDEYEKKRRPTDKGVEKPKIIEILLWPSSSSSSSSFIFCLLLLLFKLVDSPDRHLRFWRAAQKNWLAEMADSTNESPPPVSGSTSATTTSSATTWRKISLPLPHLFPHLTINFRGHLPARPPSPTQSGGAPPPPPPAKSKGRDWKLRRQKTYDSPGCLNSPAAKPPQHRSTTVSPPANNLTAYKVNQNLAKSNECRPAQSGKLSS